MPCASCERRVPGAGGEWIHWICLLAPRRRARWIRRVTRWNGLNWFFICSVCTARNYVQGTGFFFILKTPGYYINGRGALNANGSILQIEMMEGIPYPFFLPHPSGFALEANPSREEVAHFLTEVPPPPDWD